MVCAGLVLTAVCLYQWLPMEMPMTDKHSQANPKDLQNRQLTVLTPYKKTKIYPLFLTLLNTCYCRNR
jgi:hypothetical protein